MEKERNLNHIFWAMAILNLAIILYYCLIYMATTYRLCDSFAAYAFLDSVRSLPGTPWEMAAWSVSLYLGLCTVGWGKTLLPPLRLRLRLALCIAEIFLCVGIIASLNFYYSGVALLVLADLVHYIRRPWVRYGFIAILITVFAFGQFDVVSFAAAPIPFSAYLDFYNGFARSLLSGFGTALTSMNVLTFVLFMILLFTGEQAENEHISRLNRELNQANTQLREYAVEMERMTEIRERNRFAREIHDTLGHSLTGIAMSADAALAIFETAPAEAQKRIQVIAQSARDGLTDVRRSIKALRPDALERHSLEEALTELVENFRTSTGAEIKYTQKAGPLRLAADEEEFVYRAVQEGMTNAVRHGHADNIQITLTREDRTLTVDIRDNGDGAGQVEEGFGLRHMRERLTLLGGEMAFGNGPEKGFYVTAHIPIREREGQE